MITVVDLSKRLPGPYACKRLLSLGANVLRFEDTDSSDPFSTSEMKNLNPLFYEWYNNLNKGKKKTELSFQNDQKKLIQELLTLPEYTIIIHSLGDKKESELFNNPSIVSEIEKKKFIILSIKASIESPHLHDLNVLALNGLLDYHSTHFRGQTTIAPPFLPIAGISFGHTIAEKALYLWINKSNGFHHIYLANEIRESLGLLKGSVDKALHNGLFPSYQIYQTKDFKFVALALIEEKFWNEFLLISKLPLQSLDRFSTEKDVFLKIEEYFLSMDSCELKKLYEKLSSLTIYP